MPSTVGLSADISSALPLAGWPAWGVPVEAVGEWVDLQLALRGLLPRVPVCYSDPEGWWVTGASPKRLEEAVEACGWCPVREACLAYAVAAREAYGVWGGSTPAERAGLRGAS